MSDSANLSPLGKEVIYKDTYDASLLFGIDRIENRNKLIINDELTGVDIWNGYEISWLNPKGKPVIRQAVFSINCQTQNIIESKSFKLYLNSFNQNQFNDQSEVIEIMQRDLSACANGEVSVEFFNVGQINNAQDFSEFECIDELDVDINQYDVDANLLNADATSLVLNQKYVSHLLKSNCPVTGQPDWGSVFIALDGPQLDQESLLKYLISFRQHGEFHEHCVEQIFCDLNRLFNPSSLLVCAKYVRRGGLDINPVRVKNMDVELVKGIRVSRQ
ncbi:NADPH-dependent 7-cyano-7-deazaguanine reductase QueF [Marinicellulosiphila megalodicopiae]|uniref:NADPH-dependent 7-cyano-7-deazaguanine reductase QueF n=1 Tax=Marinicellulosiphila megalodicopiae TaxID=2724896 RepID=UPI003BB21AA7